jgi:alpha-glucosidase (family GH31 glycosyl hydrolase)
MIGMPAQEPYVFGDAVTDIMRASLHRRYALLPYLYTLFWQASDTGATVWRPLFFEWPADAMTWPIDSQFLIGPALLVSPALDEGQTAVQAYLPRGTWCASPRCTCVACGLTSTPHRYDWDDGTPLIGGTPYTLAAPLAKLNVHLRGGFIVPTQVLHPVFDL